MAPDTPAPPAGTPAHSAPSRRARLLRGLWPYLLAGLALLAASEMLWIWHSWPVRELLDSERVSAGATP